jgi:uncharacterized protein YktA (UPF0223 family)
LDYPIDYSIYTKEEIITIIDFLDSIESYHLHPEPKKVADLKRKHERFKSVLNNKTEEKKMDKAFKQLTNVSIYQTMKNL